MFPCFYQTGLIPLQPLKVMDPDHPLAALVRKAKQERNGTAAAMASTSEEAPDPAASSTAVQYTTDREYRFLYSFIIQERETETSIDS